ncbi:carbohydrate ABC transporter permease [Natronospora cellulosivora (SeqCode)]
MDSTFNAKEKNANNKFQNSLKEFWEGVKEDRVSYLFLAPFGLLFILFVVLPVLLSVVLSFTYFNLFQSPSWVGWENYIRLFIGDDIFLTAVKNTLVFAAVTGPFGYMLSFVVAWLLNELKPKLRATLTVLFYAPAISGGGAFIVWRLIFDNDKYGYLNSWLLSNGFITEPIQFLRDTSYMMPVVLIVALWMSMGAGFLAFIAGLQGLDPKLFESAAIDGVKNRWQELWYITLPQMRPYLMFGAIMSITGSFMAAGLVTGMIPQPPTDYATWTVVNHINDYAYIRYEMGYASAIAVILFGFMVSVQKFIQRLLSKLGE